MTADPRTRRRLEHLAWLLDDSIRVPVVNRRIGVDSVIGLVPVVGDLVGGLLSTSILIGAVRLGVTWPTILRMLVNVAIEIVVGAVPLVGDLFDMGWKANRRNVALMQAHLDRPGHLDRVSRLRVYGTVSLVVLAWAASVVFVLWLAFAVVGLMAGWFG